MKRHKRGDPKREALTAIEKGALGKARSILERLLLTAPSDPEVFNNLAAVYEKQKLEPEMPIGLLQKAHNLFPEHALVRTNLIKLCFNTALIRLGNKNYQGAIALLEKTIQYDPKHILAHLEIAKCFYTIGGLDQATLHFTKAVLLEPNLDSGYTGLGLTFMEMGKLAEAKGAFQKVLELEPQKVSGYVHLGLLANKTGLTGVAVNMMYRALDLDPKNVAALNNLGLILRDQGEISAAYDCYQKAKELDPLQPEVASGLLLTLNYLPNISTEQIAEEHRRIDHVYPQIARPVPIRDRNPQKKLNIGYLSPDFHFHSVAYFMVGLLKEHDRSQVEVTCYSTGNACDPLTEQIQENTDHFISCYRWPDDQLANQIERDGIDILIELSGHTRDHRLAMLRNRVAPIQGTYLGYPNTTGLSQMDFRITDEIVDPPGKSDQLHSEKLARIEGGFLSYTPPANAWKLDVGPLPALSKPAFAFGSFNNLAKINNQVLEIWAHILNRLPHASLIIKARGMRDERVLARIRKHLNLANIDERRVQLKSYELFYEEHMSCYREIDMALDTFPYTGTTTTCEALWMGVPVLSLTGDRHAAKVGQSILTRIGLEEFIAQSPEDYVERAVQLASDLPRIANLRSGMRQRMQSSSLMDHRRMARGLESVYRSFWNTYCHSNTR